MWQRLIFSGWSKGGLGGCRPHSQITLPPPYPRGSPSGTVWFWSTGTDFFLFFLQFCPFPTSALSQSQYTSCGTSPGWYAEMKIPQTTTNVSQQRLLQGCRVPLSQHPLGDANEPAFQFASYLHSTVSYHFNHIMNSDDNTLVIS